MGRPFAPTRCRYALGQDAQSYVPPIWFGRNLPSLGEWYGLARRRCVDSECDDLSRRERLSDRVLSGESCVALASIRCTSSLLRRVSCRRSREDMTNPFKRVRANLKRTYHAASQGSFGVLRVAMRQTRSNVVYSCHHGIGAPYVHRRSVRDRAQRAACSWYP